MLDYRFSADRKMIRIQRGGNAQFNKALVARPVPCPKRYYEDLNFTFCVSEISVEYPECRQPTRENEFAFSNT